MEGQAKSLKFKDANSLLWQILKQMVINNGEDDQDEKIVSGEPIIPTTQGEADDDDVWSQVKHKGKGGISIVLSLKYYYVIMVRPFLRSLPYSGS